jgi:hypothetical protein
MAVKTHLTALYVNVIPVTQAKLAISSVQHMAHAQTAVVCVKKDGGGTFANSQTVLEILIVPSVVCAYEHRKMFSLNVSVIKDSVDRIVASYCVLEILPATTAATVF